MGVKFESILRDSRVPTYRCIVMSAKNLGALMFRIFACFAFLLVAPAAARAATLDTANVGNWLVAAYSSDSSGRFNHCAMTASYNSGLMLTFAVGRDMTWSMALSANHWRLVPGAQYDIAFQVDSNPPEIVKAYAIGASQVEITLAPTAALFQQFQSGRLLKVATAGQVFDFYLTRSDEALQLVLECAKVYAAAEMPSTNPFAAAVTPRSAPAAGANYQAEAATLVANVLSRAGIEGFHILTADETPESFAASEAVWVAPNLVGSLDIVDDRAQTRDALLASLVSSDAAVCKGKFASTTEANSQDSGHDLVTACDDGEKSAVAYYNVTRRPQGGYYVFSTGALNASAADNSNAREAGAKLNFVTQSLGKR